MLRVQQPCKLARPGVLNSSKAFNQLFLLDAFYIKWDGEKKSILAMMDALSRYEQMATLADETEIKILEYRWL